MLKTDTPIEACEIQQKIFRFNNCDISTIIDRNTGWQQRKVFQEIADVNPNVYLWEPSIYFPIDKKNNFSWRNNDGEIIMIDQHHISKDFSKSLSKYFYLFLQDIENKYNKKINNI